MVRRTRSLLQKSRSETAWCGPYDSTTRHVPSRLDAPSCRNNEASLPFTFLKARGATVPRGLFILVALPRQSCLDSDRSSDKEWLRLHHEQTESSLFRRALHSLRPTPEVAHKSTEGGLRLALRQSLRNTPAHRTLHQPTHWRFPLQLHRAAPAHVALQPARDRLLCERFLHGIHRLLPVICTEVRSALRGLHQVVVVRFHRGRPAETVLQVRLKMRWRLGRFNGSLDSLHHVRELVRALKTHRYRPCV